MSTDVGGDDGRTEVGQFVVGGDNDVDDGEKVVAGDIHSETDLLQRQKREKKELQAKITSMKRGVGKSDRTKKKEIQNEIVRLESELARKHAQELTELNEGRMKNDEGKVVETADDENRDEVTTKEETENDGDMEPTAASGKGKKVTKAQKRRDKKEAKAKESERIVAESVKEVKQGVRYKEQQLFKTVLASKGLSFHHVPADGDCLYNALAHQLSLCGLSIPMSDLRKHAAFVMISNRDDYLPFLTNAEGDMLSHEEFDDYCAKLLKPGIWGGHPELVALSTHYQRPIEVLQADASPILVGEQYLEREKPLTITYHRHAFRLGEHYNSTAPAKEGAIDDTNDDI